MKNDEFKIMNKIITTEDSSQSVYSEQFNQTYHSCGGAIGESQHVFINAGLRALTSQSVKIFELGFGTGLNALLTLQEAEKQKIQVEYHASELYPLSSEVIEKLNYPSLLPEVGGFFSELHSVREDSLAEITPYFSLCKISGDFLEINLTQQYDLVYFDAFSFDAQPELWSEAVFAKIRKAMKTSAILVTYSSKGIVKQNLRKTGFEVERLSGYKKRHILRATAV